MLPSVLQYSSLKFLQTCYRKVSILHFYFIYVNVHNYSFKSNSCRPADCFFFIYSLNIFLNQCENESNSFGFTVKPRFNGQMRTNDSPLLEKVR